MPQKEAPAKRRTNSSHPHQHQAKSAPKKQSKKAPDPAPPLTTPPPPSAQDPKHQQELLDIFSTAFSNVLTAGNFNTLLQEIKQSLYNRDFASAFGNEEYLRAYAARWSPTRALAYSAVLGELSPHLETITNDGTLSQYDGSSGNGAGREARGGTALVGDGLQEAVAESAPAAVVSQPDQQSRRSLAVLSIGGCAAEHLAVASYLHHADVEGTLCLLDSGPWANIVDLLQSHITSPPPLSKYASAAARAANRPLLPPTALRTRFEEKDVLALDRDALTEVIGTGAPVLATLLFTLNELYTSSGIGPTTKLLKNLGEGLPDRSLLLVVDSPGSYSEAAVGRAEGVEGEKKKKKYPMQWLLHHTLTDTETPGCEWERLESQDSTWFRLPEGLHYPIPLENMRYQMHLYRIRKVRG